MGRRIRWMGLVMILCFALVLVQLANLQFRQAQRTGHRGGQSPEPPARPQQRARVRSWRRRHGARLFGEGAERRPDRLQVLAGVPQSTAHSSATSSATTRASTGHGAPSTSTTTSSSPTSSPRIRGPVHQPGDQHRRRVPDRPAQLQALAQQELAGPQDGAVVVLNPTTGAVLAMYSQPDIRPQLAGLADARRSRARAAS